MNQRLPGIAIAVLLATVLTFSAAVGVFADRGGNGRSAPGGSESHGNNASNHGNGSKNQDSETNQEGASTTTPTGTAESGKHPENHGKTVSEAAHSVPKGPGHGEEVSEVARDNDGHEGTPVVDVDDETPTGTPAEGATATPTVVNLLTTTATVTPTNTSTEFATATPTATSTEEAEQTVTPTATSTEGTELTVTATSTKGNELTATTTRTPTENDREGDRAMTDTTSTSAKTYNVGDLVANLVQSLSHLFNG